MNAINAVVEKLEELDAMKSGYGNTTLNIIDLGEWLQDLPTLLNNAYEVQRQQRDTQELKTDVSRRLDQQTYNYDREKELSAV